MKISVITASYNYAKYLDAAISSVINQSYQDWELIIVDDGSSDNSVEIIKSYSKKDSRIKLFQHEDSCNKGLKETLLFGIKHATGEWIAFLESDDYLAPDYLSKKIQIAQKNPDVALIFNKVNFVADEHTKKKAKNLERLQNKLSKIKYPKNMFFDFFIDNPILTFSCVMAKADILKQPEFGADYNTPVDTFLDWWLWVHLAYKNVFYYTQEELTFWRLHGGSYIFWGEKPIFKPVQVLAYIDVWGKSGKPFSLLIFMFFSSAKLLLVRGFRFFRRLGGKLKG